MIGGFSPNVCCIGVVFGVTALILGFGASMSVFTSSLWSSLLLLPCKTATSGMFPSGKLLTLSISLLPVLAESFALALVVLPEAVRVEGGHNRYTVEKLPVHSPFVDEYPRLQRVYEVLPIHVLNVHHFLAEILQMLWLQNKWV